MDVFEFVQEVKKGSIDPIENAHKVLEESRRIDKEYSYFNTIDEKSFLDAAKQQKKSSGILAGLPISVKDCVCIKGMESTAGSAILKGYRPLFDATAVERARQQGAIVIGKTSQDEFGFGSFSTNVGKGFLIPKNPFDKSRVTGGSSGGSAGITRKANFAHLSVSESTGGSIAAPASFCGVVGITPTYGRVSRYGLIDYANSLDKIGSIGKTVSEAALLLEVMQGHDPKDSTSSKEKPESYAAIIKKDIRKQKIALLKDSFAEGIDKDIQKAMEKAKASLEECGATIEEIDLPLTSKYALPVYYLIAMSESSTNLAKYCGLRYGRSEPLEGSFDEYFSKVRELGFGDETKRRIILGTFARMAGFRDAYYIKAAKVRALIIEEYKKVFARYGAILSPAMPLIAPKFTDIRDLTPIQNYMMDILTVGPNLAGLPHASIPFGQSKDMPIGVMLMSDHFKEAQLIQIASHLEGRR